MAFSNREDYLISLASQIKAPENLQKSLILANRIYYFKMQNLSLISTHEVGHYDVTIIYLIIADLMGLGG